MARAPTELTCDMAETYGLLEYRALPVKTQAALCAGLREESRTKMKLSGMKVRPDILLLAAIADRLSLLLYSQTKDAQTGENIPESLVSLLMEEPRRESVLESFDTAEEYEAARRRILGGDA